MQNLFKKLYLNYKENIQRKQISKSADYMARKD